MNRWWPFGSFTTEDRKRLTAALVQAVANAEKLDAVLGLLRTLTRQGDAMAEDLSNLEAEVARNTSVEEFIKILMTGLAAKIEELKAGADPATQAKIDDPVATLRRDNDALAAKVTENTPSA